MVTLTQVLKNNHILRICVNVDHIIAFTPVTGKGAAKTMIVLTRDSILVSESWDEVRGITSAAWNG